MKKIVCIAICVVVMLTSMACAFSVVPVNCRWATNPYVDTCHARTNLGGFLRPSVPRLRRSQYGVVNSTGGDAGNGGGDKGGEIPESEIDKLRNQIQTVQQAVTNSQSNYDFWFGKYTKDSSDKFLPQVELAPKQLVEDKSQLTELRKKENILLASAKPAAGAAFFDINVLDLDGINFSGFYLQRTDLVGKVLRAVNTERFSLISSPPGTGKTSVLRLVADNLVKAGVKVVSIRCSRDSEMWDRLKDLGIDVKTQTVGLSTQGQSWLIMLDDAQRSYHMEQQWSNLVKDLQMPDCVRFLISTTHSLSASSPAVFRTFANRFERSSLLLSDSEADQLLKSRLPAYSHGYDSLVDSIRSECDGHVAALVISGKVLKEMVWGSDKIEDVVDESTMLTMFYNHRITDSMDRCFGNEFNQPDKQCLDLLQRCLFRRGRLEYSSLSPRDKEVCSYLVKAGILIEKDKYELVFSSRMAERYFSRWLFPKRAYENPQSLRQLIQQVLNSLSASELKGSVAQPGDFPNERTFQHVVMRALFENTVTRVDCYVCPDLSRTFAQPSKEIPGKIKFYLDGNLCWGIELLVRGLDVGEHMNRFESTGKYSGLQAKDYVVVDLRRKTTRSSAVTRDRNRVTVLFADDFKHCECIFGEEPDPIVIDLQP